jgi:hypothetical protein
MRSQRTLLQRQHPAAKLGDFVLACPEIHELDIATASGVTALDARIVCASDEP